MLNEKTQICLTLPDIDIIIKQAIYSYDNLKAYWIKLAPNVNETYSGDKKLDKYYINIQ